MADLSNSYFYNAVSGDRVYDADSFENVFNAFFNSGVSAWGGGLQVTATGGYGLSVASGLCNVSGKVFYNAAAFPLTVPTPSASVSRTDRVVVMRNDASRAISIAILSRENDDESNPSPPDDPSGTICVDLAQIQVAAGAVEITSANIVTEGVRQQVTPTVDATVLESFTAQFNKWMQDNEESLAALSDESGQITKLTNLGDTVDALATVVGSGTTGLVGKVSALEEAQESAGGVKITLLREWKSYGTNDAISPQQLITNEALTGKGATGSENNMLLLFLYSCNTVKEPLIPVLIRKGHKAVASFTSYGSGVPKPNTSTVSTGQMFTREFYWNTAAVKLLYKNDNKWTLGAVGADALTFGEKNDGKLHPYKEFAAGLCCGWGRCGNASGNIFDDWQAGVNCNKKASTAQTDNGKASGKNVQYDVYLLPAALYLITGLSSGTSES